MKKPTGVKEIDKLLVDGARFIAELKSLFEILREKQTGFNNKDPYCVLGVTEDMSLNEIKKVYRSLVLIYHPDRGEIDKEKIKEINWAYERITKK